MLRSQESKGGKKENSKPSHLILWYPWHNVAATLKRNIFWGMERIEWARRWGFGETSYWLSGYPTVGYLLFQLLFVIWAHYQAAVRINVWIPVRFLNERFLTRIIGKWDFKTSDFTEKLHCHAPLKIFTSENVFPV